MMWTDAITIDRQSLSNLAGSASFFVWLFAQSPQLYENYCNSSCDGLSIVFLIQWMAGDVTNLVGCILTQQLPFQVAVATYFCCIDLCIMVQYYYYWQRDRLLARENQVTSRRKMYDSYMSSSVPNMRSSSILPSSSRVRRETSRALSPSKSPVAEASNMSKFTSRPILSRTYDSTQSIKTFSQKARAFTELTDEYERKVNEKAVRNRLFWRRGSRKEVQNNADTSNSHRTARKGSKLQHVTSERNDDLNGGISPVQLSDSMLSDSSNGNFGYGFGSASTILDPIPQDEVADRTQKSLNNDRGRDMTRMAGRFQNVGSSISPVGMPIQNGKGQTTLESLQFPQREASIEDGESRRAFFRADSRRSIRSPTAQRNTGMVLLGLTALFALHRSNTNVRKEVSMALDADSKVYSVISPLTFSSNSMNLSSFSLHSPLPPPSWERIVGRISAWICTVLYMTSRLPQIWTNLNRKSVQGLSILLFLSAALGNALYTFSVLVNPLSSGSDRADYLWESLPFLLGSGGTLIFDAIIVSQWMAWRGNEPLADITSYPSLMTHSFIRSTSRSGGHRGNGSDRWASLERQPLLEHM